MPTLISVTRRTMLRGVAVASVYLVSGGLSPLGQIASRPAASAATFQAQDAVYATAKYFDSTWSQELTALFPVRFGIAERTDAVSLVATWDPRLFTVHGPAFAVDGEETREFELKRLDAGKLTLDVPANVDEIVLQVEVLNPYPNENLADAVVSTLTLVNGSGDLVDELVAAGTSTACAPWSVEVAVDWVSYGKDIVPAKITVTSLGPNAAPSDLALTATYPDVIAQPTVTVPDDVEDAPATAVVSSADGVSELTISTSIILLPNSQVEVLFAAKASDSVPRPFDDFVPHLRLVPPAEVLGMRNSGRHSSYPVTASGSQLSTYLLAPSAG